MSVFSAFVLAASIGSPGNLPLDQKQTQQAADLWRALQGRPQNGQILPDRIVWRTLHGSDTATVVSLDDARSFTRGCSIVNIRQEAPESLAYKLDCKGQSKFLYFAASDGYILLADIDNHPATIAVVPPR